MVLNLYVPWQYETVYQEYSLLGYSAVSELSLYLTNYALLHEGVWGSGCIDPHFLDLSTRSASHPCSFIPREKSSSTHSIGGWVDPRVGLDDVETLKFLPPPGLEVRPLGRPARSQSLYRDYEKGVVS
jgi:hypothetical protein